MTDLLSIFKLKSFEFRGHLRTVVAVLTLPGSGPPRSWRWYLRHTFVSCALIVLPR